MYTPDKQQAHSRSYEGPDLAQHKTQALFARSNCNLWVQLHKCPCISANIRSVFAAGTTTFPPPHQPSHAAAQPLACWSFEFPSEKWQCLQQEHWDPSLTQPWKEHDLERRHFYWKGEQTSHEVFLFLYRSDASLTNRKDKRSFLQPHF